LDLNEDQLETISGHDFGLQTILGADEDDFALWKSSFKLFGHGYCRENMSAGLSSG
jgi:hypothetical protein